jgi:hypothetical protein
MKALKNALQKSSSAKLLPIDAVFRPLIIGKLTDNLLSFLSVWVSNSKDRLLPWIEKSLLLEKWEALSADSKSRLLHSFR